MTAEGARNKADDICRRLQEALDHLTEAQDAATAEKLSQEVKRQLASLLEVLKDVEKSYAAGEMPVTVKAWLTKFLSAGLPKQLAQHLHQLEFEVRNDVVSVFSHVVRIGAAVDPELMREYCAEPEFFRLLVKGYDTPEMATHCGMMLRSCAREEKLVRAFFNDLELVLDMVKHTQHQPFEIATDAFSSLHDILLNHHDISAEFLEGNFRTFFTCYNKVLEEGDYVTQRQGLKLLSDLLLGRKFMKTMMAYIGDDSYLQLHMNLLREESKTIQVEAFHVFKIFVANPSRPPRIQSILYKNKEKIAKLLMELAPYRAEDKQFTEDMKTVLNKLQALEPPVRPSAPVP